jgi:hypothetical protein
MGCKGDCGKIKMVPAFGKKYSKGMKRCSVCEIWTNCKELRCLCCNSKLKTTPRGAKLRRAHRQVMEALTR